MIGVPTPETANWYGYLSREPWPEVAEHDQLYEVVNGTRVEKKVGAPEVLLANELHALLAPFARPALGWSFVEMSFALPVVGNERKPDLAFVSYGRWPRDRRIPRVNALPVAPDLVVEVISPYELTWATFTKVEEYFRAGVTQVWLILPHVERAYLYSSPTAVRILSRGDELTGDPVVPGFRLPLNDLFPPPDEGPA
ncbi:MAG: Uma2 family endonuclease [Gemmataceae bacterium]|nr:Uma2 family endonuclease [Gemmataceae bacterium]